MREAFALLGRGTSGGDDPWLQLVGQRGALRGIAPPDLARLEHRLQLSRQRHRELSAEVRGLDRRGLHGRCMEVTRLKKLRLREKDRFSGLACTLRRAREREKLPAAEIGSGAYGSVLLGRSVEPPRALVAVKIAPLIAAAEGGALIAPGGSTLQREARVLQAMHDGWHGAPRFPRPLHHGRQQVLGTECEVLVMQLLGPSVEALWWAASAGTGLEAASALRLGARLPTLPTPAPPPSRPRPRPTRPRPRPRPRPRARAQAQAQPGAGMLRCLRGLHACGWTHNDVKPAS